MAKPIDVDHPAVGAAHLFLPGSADSLVAAVFLAARLPSLAWVTIAREHRLPILLERPLAETAAEVWCLGYSGTGNTLLPAALEAHVTHRPVHWLSTTSRRLTAAAEELPGLRYESQPGGSLVTLALRHLPSEWTTDDQDYERLGHVLGRYPGARPSDGELALVNRLHAAAVTIRNEEQRGPELIRALSATPVRRWAEVGPLSELAGQGEQLIRSSRQVLYEAEPVRGGRRGPAIWQIGSGVVARGAHGKTVAAQAYSRQAPAALVEEVDHGFTKAWVVLPSHAEPLWIEITRTFASFTVDFAHTGLRGAGALPCEAVDPFVDALWQVFSP